MEIILCKFVIRLVCSNLACYPRTRMYRGLNSHHWLFVYCFFHIRESGVLWQPSKGIPEEKTMK